jgi:hypothetical protein
MYISPPITILAILAIGLAGTAWLTSPRNETTQVSVMLPTATYRKLEHWGKVQAGVDGRPLTAAQIIEELAIRKEKDNEALAN